MNELLTLIPKAPAPNLNSVSSSYTGLPLTSTLSRSSIKNAVHWVLDEDNSRIPHGQAPHNLAALRRLAPDLRRREKSAKTGSAAKRKRAGLNPDYFLRTLSQ